MSETLKIFMVVQLKWICIYEFKNNINNLNQWNTLWATILLKIKIDPIIQQ